MFMPEQPRISWLRRLIIRFLFAIGYYREPKFDTIIIPKIKKCLPPLKVEDLIEIQPMAKSAD